MTKTDMTLEIGVAVSGNIDAGGTLVATATYTQTGADPASQGVVDQYGSIDLTKMNYDSAQYNSRTDIVFNLSGTITDASGNSVPFGFPADANSAVTITVPAGGSGTEIVPQSGTSSQQLILDDQDEDGDTYQYCLAPVAQPAGGNPIPFQLDPRIVNR